MISKKIRHLQSFKNIQPIQKISLDLHAQIQIYLLEIDHIYNELDYPIQLFSTENSIWEDQNNCVISCLIKAKNLLKTIFTSLEKECTISSYTVKRRYSLLSNLQVTIKHLKELEEDLSNIEFEKSELKLFSTRKNEILNNINIIVDQIEAIKTSIIALSHQMVFLSKKYDHI